MNPSSAAPNSSRSRAIMEEFNRLEERRHQVQRNRFRDQSSSRASLQPPSADSAVKGLLQGQIRQSVPHESLLSLNTGRLSLEMSNSGNIHDPLLGFRDLAQLQALLRIREQQQEQSSKLASNRAVSSLQGLGNFNLAPTHQERLLSPSNQIPGISKSAMLSIPIGGLSVESLRRRGLNDM